MTEVYLGKPPARVEAWIKEHFKTATWVPAVYTDEWLFSDGKNYDIQYTTYDPGDPDHPEGFTDWWLIPSQGICYSVTVTGNPDIPQHATTLNFNHPENSYTTYAYRVFTPGHWEDGDGKWINGSWSDIDPIYAGKYDFLVYWVEKGGTLDGTTASKAGWYWNLQVWLSDDINASFFVYSQDETYSYRRVWTNTVPKS